MVLQDLLWNQPVHLTLQNSEGATYAVPQLTAQLVMWHEPTQVIGLANLWTWSTHVSFHSLLFCGGCGNMFQLTYCQLLRFFVWPQFLTFGLKCQHTAWLDRLVFPCLWMGVQFGCCLSFIGVCWQQAQDLCDISFALFAYQRTPTFEKEVN